jgi:hypothetical protein
MTKKHFIALADTVRYLKPLPPEGDVENEQEERFFGAFRKWEETRNELARFCASQNSRFDRDLWINYIDGKCGPSGGKIK